MHRVKVAYVPQQDDRQIGISLNWRRLRKYLILKELVSKVDIASAEVVHVASDAICPDTHLPVLYTCRGGFLPVIHSAHENARRATRIMCNSEWLIAAMLPQHRHKTVIIANGIDPDEWQDIAVRDEDYILFKSYSYQPGHVEYVLAAARVHSGRRFVMLGSPPVGANIPDNVKTVEAPVPVFEAQNLIAKCSIFISSSLETFGTMTVEAWYCRKPVIGIAIGGNAELMAKCQDGLLYTNADELVRCIDQAHPSMGDRGCAMVEADYMWPDMVHDIHNLYLECIR